MRAFLPVSALLVLCLGVSASAQSGVGVEVADVTDNRLSHEMMQGALELRLKLTGENLDRVVAARVLIREAIDDRGTALKIGSDLPDFSPSEYNVMGLQVGVSQPPRSAKSVRIKGAVELYVPSRDPNALVKIDKPLSKLDKPLASPKLKAAKITLTPLSPKGYAAIQEERKLTPEKLEQLRAEGRKQGVPEKEIELMLGLAEALGSLDGPLEEGSIALRGKESDFDRIFRVDFLAQDGVPVTMTSRGTSSRGEDDALMTLQPSDALPPNAPMQISILTEKSKMSFPFELTVDLP
jgi:hypothetical protein